MASDRARGKLAKYEAKLGGTHPAPPADMYSAEAIEAINREQLAMIPTLLGLAALL